MTLETALAIGLFTLAIGVSITGIILQAIERDERRKLRAANDNAARRFRTAREKGDTRGQHDAAQAARDAMTARLRREVGR